MKLVIDAGHGGTDPGAVNTGLRLLEADLCLQMALLAKVQSEQAGHEVILTRDADFPFSISQRVRLINDSGADLLVSIHCNAAVSAAARGYEVLHWRHSDQSRQLAQICCECFRSHFPDRVNRGPKPDSVSPRGVVAILRDTKMAAVLIEVGFISHDEEAAWMRDNLLPIASCIAHAVCKMAAQL